MRVGLLDLRRKQVSFLETANFLVHLRFVLKLLLQRGIQLIYVESKNRRLKLCIIQKCKRRLRFILHELAYALLYLLELLGEPAYALFDKHQVVIRHRKWK